MLVHASLLGVASVACLLNAVLATYAEHVAFTPLPNSLLLSEFDFSAAQPATDGDHYTLFPRTLGQILAQSGASELHLRFSQGWWDHESWGVEPKNGSAAGGIGVELWAHVEAPSRDQALERWYRLVHSLSGLFCASLNFIDEQHTSIRPGAEGGSGWVLRGALPGEPVCTENLTPFVKLLPCKAWSGIGAVLDGHSLFDAQWQTMALDVKRGSKLEFNQSISSVMNVPRLLRRRVSPLPKPLPRAELNCKPDFPGCLPVAEAEHTWDLADIFGELRPCPLADTSSVEVSRWDVLRNGQPAPAQFELEGPSNLTISGPALVDAAASAAASVPPISVDRSFTGAGQQDGGVRLVFTNHRDTPSTLEYREVLPWYMRVYLHTLSAPEGTIKNIEYSGARLRGRPTQMDLRLELPPSAQISIEYQFDKSLLFIEEYPPDANHGFEIAPGVASFEGYVTRTTSLLLSLPVPDFSMPYNVIILTCTTLTLMVCNVLNMLIKVPIPESVAERYNRGKLQQLAEGLRGGLKAAMARVRGLLKRSKAKED